MKLLVQSFLWSVAGVAACLFFFSPKLLIFTEQAPGTYEWTRGLNFLQQISGDAGEKVEPALQHRLLPVAVCKLLGLDGIEPFTLGWLGVLFLLFITHRLLIKQKLPTELAVCGVFMMASTSAVVTSLGWLGIMDGWWVAALLVVSFACAPWQILLTSCLAPWIDERFLIGLPVAFLCRWLIEPASTQKIAKTGSWIILGAAPYLAWRIFSFVHHPGDQSAKLLSFDFLVWLRMAPHGWWMAYRLAWIPILLCFFLPNASRTKAPLLFGAVVLSGSVAVVTAADLSRSAMVICPLIIAGLILAYRAKPVETAKITPWLAGANYLIPYMHIVYNKVEPVHPLLWEVIRLIKKLCS
jgi:hypothetical protein